MTSVEFAARLSSSGLMTSSEAEASLKTFIDSRKGAVTTDLEELNVHELAKELVQRRRATMFQISALFLQRPTHLVFGDYEIIDKLASGGMGEVYKAVARRDATPAVLKLLPPKAASEPEMVQRFHREIRLLLKMRHPNVVNALDAGRQGDEYYLVMEYVEGSDLSRVLKQRGRLSCDEAVQYVLQAARGIGHAHDQGIIHRDVKPSNLMVDAEGRVKVLDLGLARLIDDNDPLTHTGSVLGSIDYMAPEQAFDSKQIDHRADVYSLGCTLYFLLTGETVYQGRTIMQKVVAHRDHPIPSLAAVRLEVPCELDSLFRRMVAKKKEDRIGSMAEVVDALTKLEPVGAALNESQLNAASPSQRSPAPPSAQFNSARFRIPTPGGAWSSPHSQVSDLASPTIATGKPVRLGAPIVQQALALTPPPTVESSKTPALGSFHRRAWREHPAPVESLRSWLPWLGVATALIFILSVFFSILRVSR